MSEHQAKLEWTRESHPSEPGTYSRNHTVEVNGDQLIRVSASSEFKGDPNIADPEQLLVGAVSSCMMLFFLAIAEARGFRVERYADRPTGFLEKPEGGGPKMVARIHLHPFVSFGGERQPSDAEFHKLIESAHKQCFIANSIKAEVSVMGEFEMMECQ